MAELVYDPVSRTWSTRNDIAAEVAEFPPEAALPYQLAPLGVPSETIDLLMQGTQLAWQPEQRVQEQQRVNMLTVALASAAVVIMLSFFRG